MCIKVQITLIPIQLSQLKPKVWISQSKTTLQSFRFVLRRKTLLILRAELLNAINN